MLYLELQYATKTKHARSSANMTHESRGSEKLHHILTNPQVVQPYDASIQSTSAADQLPPSSQQQPIPTQQTIAAATLTHIPTVFATVSPVHPTTFITPDDSQTVSRGTIFPTFPSPLNSARSIFEASIPAETSSGSNSSILSHPPPLISAENSTNAYQQQQDLEPPSLESTSKLCHVGPAGFIPAPLPPQLIPVSRYIQLKQDPERPSPAALWHAGRQPSIINFSQEGKSNIISLALQSPSVQGQWPTSNTIPTRFSYHLQGESSGSSAGGFQPLSPLSPLSPALTGSSGRLIYLFVYCLIDVPFFVIASEGVTPHLVLCSFSPADNFFLKVCGNILIILG